MIKIICVGGKQCVNVINKCLSSVVNQTYKEWEMAVCLDPGAYNIYVDDARITVNINKSQIFATENMVNAVSILKPKDYDILLWLDADDWLSCNESFETIIREYKNNPSCLVTHGSFDSFPHSNSYVETNKPYTKKEFENLRKSTWRASHLKTMKYIVYKNINDNDLRGPDGKYFNTGCDVNVMYPSLEMAGFDRVRRIKKVLYIYNISGVRVPHTHKKESREHKKYLDNSPKYKRLEC